MPGLFKIFGEMSKTFGDYNKKWKRFSPALWSGASFVLPALLVPLAISAAVKGGEIAKKEIEKRKKKR